MSNILNKKRFIYLDLIKCISIFLVCFYHFAWLNFEYDFTKFYLGNIHRFILNLSTLGVPLFFMVNGALLLNSKFTLRKHLKKIFLLVMNLTIWRIILLSFFINFYNIDKMSYGKKDILTFILGGNFNKIDVSFLWFMYALIGLYLIYPILKLTFDNDENFKVCTYIIILLSLMYMGSNIIKHINDYLIFKGLNISIEQNIFLKFNILGNYGYTIIYFLLGGIIHNLILNNSIKLKVKHLIITFLIGWIFLNILQLFKTNIYKNMWDAVFFGYQEFSTLLMSFSIFILCSNINIKNIYFKKCINIVGNNTLAVYYIHWVLGFLILPKLKLVFTISTILSNSIKSIILIFVSIVISLFIKKIPYLKNIL